MALQAAGEAGCTYCRVFTKEVLRRAGGREISSDYPTYIGHPKKIIFRVGELHRISVKVKSYDTTTSSTFPTTSEIESIFHMSLIPDTWREFFLMNSRPQIHS
jgi:hypothetical protein